MRTVSRKTTGLIATIFLAATLGVVLLLYVTSGQQPRCDTVDSDNINMIELIYS
jgi:hypothetical protein